MTLTFKSFNAKNTAAIYTGAKNPVRFSLSAFPDKVAPPTIEIADGVLATKSEPKVKLTAEERKAARAAAPKLTLAERAERARVRAEKLAAEAAAETQPSL